MKNVAPLLLAIAGLVLTSCGSSHGGAVAANAAFGFCPVCHMKVKAADDWTAEIFYKDGTKLMFESPADMLAFFTEPKRYDVDDAHKDLSRVDMVSVKDYQSKQKLDARDASFVYDSSVEGPMGPDFNPFASEELAETFIAANGGVLVSLGQVTADIVRQVRKP
jgi:nitrous oxide reductase accessory protein NosL